MLILAWLACLGSADYWLVYDDLSSFPCGFSSSSRLAQACSPCGGRDPRKNVESFKFSLRLQLRAVSLLPCSFGQPKLQVTAQILQGAAKSHYKWCAYREGWKIQVIFVIDLLYYLKSFQFHQEVIKKIPNFYVPNKISWKYENEDRFFIFIFYYFTMKKKTTTIRKGDMECLAGRVRDLTKIAQLG